MTRILRTPRLRLRPFEAADAARLVEISNDLRVSENLTLKPFPYTAGSAEEFLEVWTKIPPLHYYAACLADGTLIGCGAWGTGPEHPVPDIAYWLAFDFWGRGYGAEIAAAMAAEAFRQTGAKRITANCRVTNKASRAILTDMGFAPSGFETCHSRALDAPVETECFTLSREDWMRAPVTTPRLRLRALESHDAEAMARLADDIGVAGNLGRVPHPYSLVDAEEFIAFTRKLKPAERAFAITAKADGALMGVASFDRINGNAPELGYWLGRPFWGQGFGREAAFAIVAEAFGRCGHEGMETGCRIGNEASRRIILSLGFEITGRQEVWSRGLNGGMEIERFRLTRAQWLASLRQPVHT